jgi:uncharacterized membrane protein YidH (DUF202 family)
MGFGIVLANFGIFPAELRLTFGVQSHDFSRWFGAALIAVGVTVNLFSALRYMRLVGELNHGQFVHRSVSKQGVVVAMFLALLSIAMAIYTLHA